MVTESINARYTAGFIADRVGHHDRPVGYGLDVILICSIYPLLDSITTAGHIGPPRGGDY